jgi:nucleotide-binding universal stress UspA family protein
MDEDERRRLRNEAVDARGFVMNLERLLVAVDGSPKGKFAARIAGTFAGSKGMPVTILKIDGAQAETDPEATVREAAQRRLPGEADVAEGVYVTTQVEPAPSEQAVAAAAKRGHDLLFIGVERTVGATGGFHDDVARLARGFEGPLAVVAARGVHLAEPIEGPLNILVPVTGADASRRGAELAFTLGRAANGPITILHVADPVTTEALRRGRPQPRMDSTALRSEVEKLALRFGVTVKIVVRVNIAPEVAILRQARLGNHNLIVMGVSRRRGDSLSFGNVAGAILESAERSLLFVSTGL